MTLDSPPGLDMRRCVRSSHHIGKVLVALTTHTSRRMVPTSSPSCRIVARDVKAVFRKSGDEGPASVDCGARANTGTYAARIFARSSGMVARP
jgi:hypothetical protein